MHEADAVELFVFFDRRDVEPTNNAAEKALRPLVILQKKTNGWAPRVYADVSSIVATGRLAGHSALAALRGALTEPPRPGAAKSADDMG